jgi:hypothetical protein
MKKVKLTNIHDGKIIFIEIGFGERVMGKLIFKDSMDMIGVKYLLAFEKDCGVEFTPRATPMDS